MTRRRKGPSRTTENRRRDLAREEERRVEREATAYHEAGHAVAYIRSGLDFAHVTLRPDPVGGTAARVVLREPRDIDGRVAALILASGPEAEATAEWRHGGGDRDAVSVDLWVWGDSVRGIDGDAANLRGLTERVAEHAPHRLPEMEFGALMTRTRAFVDEHWPEIAALAEALIACPGSLGYAECVAAVEAASPADLGAARDPAASKGPS